VIGIDAQHRDLASRARLKALEEFDRSRLAGPVGTEEGEDLTLPDARHRIDTAVRLAQAARHQRGPFTRRWLMCRELTFQCSHGQSPQSRIG
jgi:hypothetical protein